MFSRLVLAVSVDVIEGFAVGSPQAVICVPRQRPSTPLACSLPHSVFVPGPRSVPTGSCREQLAQQCFWFCCLLGKKVAFRFIARLAPVTKLLAPLLARVFPLSGVWAAPVLVSCSESTSGFDPMLRTLYTPSMDVDGLSWASNLKLATFSVVDGDPGETERRQLFWDWS